MESLYNIRFMVSINLNWEFLFKPLIFNNPSYEWIKNIKVYFWSAESYHKKLSKNKGLNQPNNYSFYLKIDHRLKGE